MTIGPMTPGLPEFTDEPILGIPEVVRAASPAAPGEVAIQQFNPAERGPVIDQSVVDEARSWIGAVVSSGEKP